MIEHVSAGIIITAASFNPSIFTETWLDSNSVIKAECLDGRRIFSPEVAQFQTEEVQILVVPVKLQILFSISEIEGELDAPCKIATRIVELLPQTPFQGLGLNFDFFVSPPKEHEYDVYNRALYGTGDCALLKEFSAEDARFGRYFSKNFGDARLKLNILPVKTGPEDKEHIQFSFNFHHDLDSIDLSERANKLIDYLRSWATLREYSAKLVELSAKF